MMPRERLWRTLEEEARRRGEPARFSLCYHGDERLALDVELVEGDPRVHVTAALLRQLRRVEKGRTHGGALAGWENYAQRVRENQGALVSLNTATQAVCVPLSSPGRTTLNVNVFRELHFQREELAGLLPGVLARRLGGCEDLSIERLAAELFSRPIRKRRSAPQPAVEDVASAAEQRPPHPASSTERRDKASQHPRPQAAGRRARQGGSEQPEVLFSWLHVSDLHFGHGSTSHRWDQALVMKALCEDVATVVPERVPALDAIFVTGDVAFSGDTHPRPDGTAAREYEDARQFLRALGEAARLDRQRIFLVPGNHDVQRPADRDPSVRRLVGRLRDGSEPLDDALLHGSDRALLVRRQVHYLAFAAGYAPTCSSSGEPPEPPLWWSHALAARGGLRVQIAGLNTALLCADDHDQGRLFVGKAQIKDLLEARSRPDELAIVLSHHPLRGGWLADEDEASAWLRRRFHVHLHGHLHVADSEDTRAASGDRFVCVAAGAAHHEERATPTHGYNLAAVLRLPDGALRLRIWPRRWSSKRTDFRVDIENVLGEERPYAEHMLPLRLPAAGPRPRRGAHAAR